ncbi:sulfatase [Novipirellula artificiosorum]|uniref:Arylsulfatase n=1 Tax=Novipirellula artificiosorum TaxID=2528016 RepID=A0A5C6DYQ6_9BACT|nr:sulfatase [Novipirellula artificiosorum]TWU40541.1 Arylsulfatase [Novipirellula artificiosorum]
MNQQPTCLKNAGRDAQRGTLPQPAASVGRFNILIASLLLLANLHAGRILAADPPNIVLLLADDLGWTGLGCFGSDFYETPNLDNLAARGVKFTAAYSACTVCSPTRASIMTGKSPARLHLTDFIPGQSNPSAKLRIPDWNKRLEPTETTIAELLHDAGYRTGHIGKWHLSGRGDAMAGTLPTDQGFDETFEPPSNARKGYLLKQPSKGESKSTFLTDLLTDKACEFIERSQADPFFLYFAYHVPHTPIQGRADLVEYFEQRVDPNAVHNNPTYAAMVASLDQSVGRIVAELDEHHLTEETVIVFISDNGGLTQRHGVHDGFTENLPLRRGKGSAYEGGVRVPAIVSWPGVTKAGAVCDDPVITTDLFPTIAEIAGVATDSLTLDGQSLTPLLRNTSTTLERDLFWHYPHYHAGGDSPYSAIRSGNFRLIEFYEDHSVRLYDLAQDVGEQDDLSSTNPEKTMQLSNQLHQWLASVGAQMPTPNSADAADRPRINSKRSANGNP